MSQAALTAYSKSNASANLYATMGELPETLELIRDVFTKLYKVAIYCKKRKFNKIWKMVKKSDIVDLRMTYRYGIKPLAYDLKNYSEVLDKYSQKPQTKFVARSTYKFPQKKILQDFTIPNLPIWNGQYKFIGKYSAVMTGKARAGVLYDVTQEGLAHYLGLYEIPQAVWELTTLSFVIDWFCNAGTIISALTPKAGLKEKLAWKSARYTINEIAFVQFVLPVSANPTLDEVISNSPFTVVKTTETVLRQPTYLNQNLTLLKPDIRLSLDQIGDLASIIRGFFKK